MLERVVILSRVWSMEGMERFSFWIWSVSLGWVSEGLGKSFSVRCKHAQARQILSSGLGCDMFILDARCWKWRTGFPRNWSCGEFLMIHRMAR